MRNANQVRSNRRFARKTIVKWEKKLKCENRKKLNASAEAREGITYQSNSEIDIGFELNDKSTTCIAPTIDDTTKPVIFDIETISPKRAITGFIAFLESVSSSVMLAAHNGLSFDVPRILTLIKQVNLLREFQSIVVGFTDTLTVLMKHLNERRAEKKSFAQSALAEDFLGSIFVEESAHDASVDVSILQQIINHKDKYFFERLDERRLTKKNDGSKQQCGFSVNIITKIAKAGISMCLLQKTYKNNGFEGLKILLSQSINQKPRVTARIMTIIAIQKKLHELMGSHVE
ncbi:hypothetical protein PV325_005807 [Microctonus aethiopoides]|nr:hypothetical protein PV325_005807 [Microctonus aethiopoides]